MPRGLRPPPGAARAASLRPVLRAVRATRYVTPLREGGSLPGLVEADDDGLYVLKFRGAGQGPRRSWPTCWAGSWRGRSGLPVPELVRADWTPSWAGPSPTPRSRTSSRPAPA